MILFCDGTKTYETVLFLEFVTCQERIIRTNKRVYFWCFIRCRELARKLISWYRQGIVKKRGQRNTQLVVEYIISVQKSIYNSIIRIYVQLYVWWMESSNDSTHNRSKNYQDEIFIVPTLNPIWERFRNIYLLISHKKLNPNNADSNLSCSVWFYCWHQLRWRQDQFYFSSRGWDLLLDFKLLCTVLLRIWPWTCYWFSKRIIR